MGDQGSSLPRLDLVPPEIAKPNESEPSGSNPIFDHSDHSPNDQNLPDQAGKIEVSSSVRYKGSHFLYHRRQ